MFFSLFSFVIFWNAWPTWLPILFNASLACFATWFVDCVTFLTALSCSVWPVLFWSLAIDWLADWFVLLLLLPLSNPVIFWNTLLFWFCACTVYEIGIKIAESNNKGRIYLSIQKSFKLNIKMSDLYIRVI